MKVISYIRSLPIKSQSEISDKANTLRYFAEGVQSVGDTGIVSMSTACQPCDVAVILGWVHEHGKSAPHLEFRQRILDTQRLSGGRTIIADSNLFLYKDTSDPGYFLRYSYDGVFPNTGEYCNSSTTDERWNIIQSQLNVTLRPYRQTGNHILLCLQRNGGWSMAGDDVVTWTLLTINQIRQYSSRPIRIRVHPGDKQAPVYTNEILRSCATHQYKDIQISNPKTALTQDLKHCWAVVNHNSNPTVSALIEGFPVFVTDPEKSQCRDVANTDLSQIETPILFDRQAWIQKISQCHWSHAELRSGQCWQHMKKWAKK